MLKVSDIRGICNHRPREQTSHDLVTWPSCHLIIAAIVLSAGCDPVAKCPSLEGIWLLGTGVMAAVVARDRRESVGMAEWE